MHRIYLLFLLLLFAGSTPSKASEPIALRTLMGTTHVHGIIVHPTDKASLVLATHHGIYRLRLATMSATRVSVEQDFMGFLPHPNDRSTLFGSGHPAEGGNAGFIVSTDEGQTWSQISPGVDGPVDFHHIAASRADPHRIYGASSDLQVSRDGGKSWTREGTVPSRLIDLAVSGSSPDTLYAGTAGGLFLSKDAGKSWQSVVRGMPVTAVDVAEDRAIHAFVVGRGFVRGTEPDLTFSVLSSDWAGQEYLMHVAIDASDERRLFAVTGDNVLVSSGDGGRTWASILDQ